MRDRKKIAIPTLIRVDSINSIHSLSILETERGDIHDFYELVFVESGTFPLLVDGTPCEIPAGCAFIYAPNTYHMKNEALPAQEVFVHIVSFDCHSLAMQACSNRLLTPDAATTEKMLTFFSEAHAAIQGAAPLGVAPREGVLPHTLQLLGCRLEEILLLLYAGEDEHPRIGGRRAYKKERFHTLSEYLKRNLAKKHTLADMAEACACSISTVKALCHEFCGTSPNDYLISLRIERARELIREGSMNFTEIAEEVGFGSLHYFSRTFRARTGQTLTQYAKMTAG